jgi:hypothetical protein
MSLSLLRKQVYHCLLNQEAEDSKLLRKKHKKNLSKIKLNPDLEARKRENLEYFELNRKHGKISRKIKNTVIKNYIKNKN